MSELLLVKSIIWSPLLQVVILTFGVVLSFLIAFYRGDVNLYLPFISETGAYAPEMCIFSLFLLVGSFIGCIFTGIRYLHLSQNNNETLKCLNIASFYVGISAMFGLAGVAAFPMTTIFGAHIVLAGWYFLASGVYFILSTFITWKMEGSSKKFIFRCILTVILLDLLFILIICFPIGLNKWREFNDILPALKEPKHKGFGLLMLCSVLEWGSVITICMYNLTFILEIKNHGLLLTMTPVKNESNSAEQGEIVQNHGLPITPVNNESNSAEQDSPTVPENPT